MKKPIAVFLLTFLALSLLSGFSLWTTRAQDNQIGQGEIIEFRNLAKGFNSDEHEAKNMVIRTQEEWAKLWEAIYANTSEKPQLPEVDFRKRMIIAIFVGDKPSGGQEVSVLETFKSSKKFLRVSYKITTPGANCVNAQALTQPYHIIETDRAKKVSFNLLQDVKDCR